MISTLEQTDLDAGIFLSLVQTAVGEDSRGYVWSLSQNALARTDVAALKRYMERDFGNCRLYLCNHGEVAYGILGALNLEKSDGEANLLAWASPLYRKHTIIGRSWVEFLRSERVHGVYTLHANIKLANVLSRSLAAKLSFRSEPAEAGSSNLSEKRMHYYRTTALTRFEMRLSERWNI